MTLLFYQVVYQIGEWKFKFRYYVASAINIILKIGDAKTLFSPHISQVNLCVPKLLIHCHYTQVEFSFLAIFMWFLLRYISSKIQQYSSFGSMKLHSKMFSQFVRQLTTNSCNHQSVPLTKVRYPHLKRGQYAEISEKHIQMFERIVSKNQILTDPSDVEPYNIDWLKMVCGEYLQA